MGEQAETNFRARGVRVAGLRWGRMYLALMARFTRAATMVSALSAIWRGPYLTAGWGWDEQFPLRPWPVFWSDRKPRGRIYRSVTWCGFFVGVAL
jgi:hypothetical protein